jgi:dimethylsulfone monooxygenase
MLAGIFTISLTRIMLSLIFRKIDQDFLRWRGINVETCKCGPSSMRLGIWTPLPHTIRAEPAMEEGVRQVKTRGDGGADKSFEFALEVVSKGEALGFDITLIAERLLGPDLEAWMLTAALAARTKTIQIMPAVYPGMITPQMAAKMGATLDRITGGRFAINVVNGWYQKEFELFSNGGWIASSEARYNRMNEFVQVLKGLWTEEHLTFRGEFFQADDATLPMKPVRAPHPPIYTASRTDSGKDVIAQHCDLWFVNYVADYRKYEENFAAVRRDIVDLTERTRHFGRKLAFGMSAHIICADTLGEAHARADELESYGQRDRISSTAARGLGACLVGTPDLISERMRRYEDIGVELFLLNFHPMLPGLEIFARSVMPLLPAIGSGPRLARLA